MDHRPEAPDSNDGLGRSGRCEASRGFALAASVLLSRRPATVSCGSIREKVFNSSILIMWLSTKFRRRYTSSRLWPTTRSTGRTYPGKFRACICQRELAMFRSTTPLSAWRRRRRFISSTSWRARIATGGRWSTTARCSTRTLRPGPYRFRVIASNNSGVWNEQGDTLEFSVLPAYYQTNWFRRSVRDRLYGIALGGLPVACPAIASCSST